MESSSGEDWATTLARGDRIMSRRRQAVIRLAQALHSTIENWVRRQLKRLVYTLRRNAILARRDPELEEAVDNIVV